MNPNKVITHIYEIDENNFIFCSSKNFSISLCGPDHNYLKIKKVYLRNISTEIISKQKDLESDDYYGEGIDKNEEKIISSLKLIFNFQLLMEYSTFDYHCISDFVVLKKKYFLIMIDNILLIFDLSTGKQLIRYLIIDKEKTKSHKLSYEIRKWNENQFFINKDGNITLFNLDDSTKIELKIIAYSFFPNLRNIIKIDDENGFIFLI